MKPLLIFTFVALQSVNGYRIITSPDKLIWAEEEEPLELTCEVAEPWQWCYWQVTRTWDKSTMKYSTYYENTPIEGVYNDDGIKFSITEFSCGILISSLSHTLHDGVWKCHLADTDVNLSLNHDEALTSLNVASQTSLDFTWTMGESKWPHNHQLEDVVNLNCETSQNVRPRPVMSIWVVHAAQENTKLVESSFNESRISYSYELELKDDEAHFYCAVVQKREDNFPFNFENQLNSEDVNLVYGPILDVQNHPPYVFRNETLVIPIVFLAKPMPPEEDIIWQVLDLDKIQILQPGLQNEESYEALPLKFGQKDNQYISEVLLKKLSNEVDLSITIRNDINELKHTIHVGFDPPNNDKRVEEMNTGLPFWIFIIIALAILLLVLCAIFIACSTKTARNKKRDIQFKENLGNYINNSVAKDNRRKGNNNNPRVNLDEVPDQSLPMLGQDIARVTGVDPNFNRSESNENDASNEASDSNDDTLTTQDVSGYGFTPGNDTVDRRPQPPPTTIQQNSFQKAPPSTNQFLKTQPGMIASSFKPQEPNLSLRRIPASAPMRIDTRTANTLPSYRQSGNLVRVGGITHYPVISPAPPGFNPSTDPSRKTSFINHMNPREL